MERTFRQMPGPPPSGSPIESVIQRFGRMVLSIGRRAGLGEADMDELIQGVRLRLWRTQGDGDRAETVSATYVHQAARSAAIDIVRARRTVIASAAQSIEDTVLHDSTAAPDVLLEEQETAARIMDAVNELAPDRRAAVKLHLAGYRREEIASMLGWNDIRTRNLVHRDIAALKWPRRQTRAQNAWLNPR